ncbi:MAG: hypothetical protein JEZ07_19390, partial [Phycisphaerae bacterium]|nr:hypothetical protein [Phycisphaerae bacterium]
MDSKKQLELLHNSIGKILQLLKLDTLENAICLGHNWEDAFINMPMYAVDAINFIHEQGISENDLIRRTVNKLEYFYAVWETGNSTKTAYEKTFDKLLLHRPELVGLHGELGLAIADVNPDDKGKTIRIIDFILTYCCDMPEDQTARQKWAKLT